MSEGCRRCPVAVSWRSFPELPPSSRKREQVRVSTSKFHIGSTISTIPSSSASPICLVRPTSPHPQQHGQQPIWCSARPERDACADATCLPRSCHRLSGPPFVFHSSHARLRSLVSALWVSCIAMLCATRLHHAGSRGGPEGSCVDEAN